MTRSGFMSSPGPYISILWKLDLTPAKHLMSDPDMERSRAATADTAAITLLVAARAVVDSCGIVPRSQSSYDLRDHQSAPAPDWGRHKESGFRCDIREEIHMPIVELLHCSND